ncbi:MAG: hypothetical protein AAF733_12695 [Verrucomicrobiota bacterium]
MIIGGACLASAALLALSCFLQRVGAIAASEFPDTVPEKWLTTRLQARWYALLARASLFVVWLYSWQDLFSD